MLATGVAFAGNLPESPTAPTVGSRAPDFTLPDTDGKAQTLSALLGSADRKGAAGILLIFYRGYW